MRSLAGGKQKVILQVVVHVAMLARQVKITRIRGNGSGEVAHVVDANPRQPLNRLRHMIVQTPAVTRPALVLYAHTLVDIERRLSWKGDWDFLQVCLPQKSEHRAVPRSPRKVLFEPYVGVKEKAEGAIGHERSAPPPRARPNPPSAAPPTRHPQVKNRRRSRTRSLGRRP